MKYFVLFMLCVFIGGDRGFSIFLIMGVILLVIDANKSYNEGKELSISYEYELQTTKTLRDSHDSDNSMDFATQISLQKAVAKHFNDFTCPECGSHRVDGYGIIVRYGEINFFKEISYKGFFGGTKYKDERSKTIYRIYEMGLRAGQEGGFFQSGTTAGRLWCEATGCEWKEVATTYPKESNIKWYSINDIMNKNPFK